MIADVKDLPEPVESGRVFRLAHSIEIDEFPPYGQQVGDIGQMMSDQSGRLAQLTQRTFPGGPYCRARCYFPRKRVYDKTSEGSFQ